MMALFAVSVHWSLWTLFVGPSRAQPADPSGGGAAELEAAAAAQFGALPLSMAAGGAARRAAVRRYRSKLGKKACSAKRRGRKRLDCGLRLARALAADGRHEEAVGAAQAAADDAPAGDGEEALGARLDGAFGLFWLAQQAAHAQALPAAQQEATLEDAAGRLFGLLSAQPQPPEAWRALLDCVGLLHPLPRAEQTAACDQFLEASVTTTTRSRSRSAATSPCTGAGCCCWTGWWAGCCRPSSRPRPRWPAPRRTGSRRGRPAFGG